MTTKEFQEKYHDYMTTDEKEARILALKVGSVKNEDGSTEVIHAIKLGENWCLMVNSAAKLLEETGII